MRHMVQDWGFDYIYLRHECALTRVNLKNHTYRDVTHMPMEEFDSGLSECSMEDSEQANNPNLWLCGASKSSIQTDGSQWCKEVLNEYYMPCPFFEDLMEPLEWIHSLATLDTSVVRSGAKFCDVEGYDAHPFLMIDVVNPPDEELQVSNFLVDEVSIEDVSIERDSLGEKEGEITDKSQDEIDWEVPEEELEKVRLLLKHREAVKCFHHSGEKATTLL